MKIQATIKLFMPYSDIPDGGPDQPIATFKGAVDVELTREARKRLVEGKPMPFNIKGRRLIAQSYSEKTSTMILHGTIRSFSPQALDELRSKGWTIHRRAFSRYGIRR